MSRVSIPCWVSTASRPLIASVVASVVAFQSRVGFLPRRDRRLFGRRDLLEHSFNPVLGFYRVATWRKPDAYLCEVVSIPCWVSTASRLLDLLAVPFDLLGFNPVLGFYRVATSSSNSAATSASGFNPVLGFYRVATGRMNTTVDRIERFQSRVGFLPRRDRRPSRQSWRPRSVSIPCWVSTASRHGHELPRRERFGVSIPCWVSTASRQDAECDQPKDEDGFNPVLGFYRVATDPTARKGRTANPFQSRVGFLPRRDPARGRRRSIPMTVSIPCWVSTASRRYDYSGALFSQSSFNPVLGFYRVATASAATLAHPLRCFNPVLGFYRVATSRAVWSRRMLVVFQSRVGFLPRRDLLGVFAELEAEISFNPVLGFYRVATDQLIPPLVRRCVSIPCWVSTASRP